MTVRHGRHFLLRRTEDMSCETEYEHLSPLPRMNPLHNAPRKGLGVALDAT